MDLQGKTAVITGASRGIGAAIAKEALAQGMNIAVCARSQPAVDQEARTLSRSVDVRNHDAMSSFCNDTIAKFGQIDLWVNNAGVLGPIAPVRNCRADELQSHMDINIMGVFVGTQLFANHVHNRDGEGVLINISSGAATSAYAGWGAYCAGKAAVDRLTEVVALEEADSDLRAYSVAPGIIDTDMQALIRSASEEDFPMVGKFHELKRDDAFSSSEFVAKSILELSFDPKARPSQVCTRLPPGK